MWLMLFFNDFCSFRPVAVNRMYKLQFLHIFVLNDIRNSGTVFNMLLFSNHLLTISDGASTELGRILGSNNSIVQSHFLLIHAQCEDMAVKQ